MPVDAGAPTYQIWGAGCCKSSSLIVTAHASPWIPDPYRATGHALIAGIARLAGVSKTTVITDYR